MNYRRYFNYILQLSWPFLSNIIISKFEKTDPILKGNREGKGNTCDFDGNGSNPIIVILAVMIRAVLMNLKIVTIFRSGIQQMIILVSVLRMNTTGAVRSVLL